MQQSTVILWLRKPRSGILHDYRDAAVFEKLLAFSKRFPSSRKREASVFKLIRFEECFRKAPFSKCFLPIRKRKVGDIKFLRFGERFSKRSVFVTDYGGRTEIR